MKPIIILIAAVLVCLQSSLVPALATTPGCVLLWDAGLYAYGEGYGWHHFVSVTVEDDIWGVRSDAYFQNGDPSCPICSWSVQIPLPQDGQIVQIQLNGEQILLAYADGKVFGAPFVIHDVGGIPCVVECVPPSAWQLVRDWELSGNCFQGPAGLNEPVMAQPSTTTASIGTTNPNPFSRSTTLSFGLAEATHVRVEIVDTAGRLLRTLLDADLTSGPHALPWDGANDQGVPVSAGAYFCQIRVGEEVHSRKLIILR